MSLARTVLTETGSGGISQFEKAWRSPTALAAQQLEWRVTAYPLPLTEPLWPLIPGWTHLYSAASQFREATDVLVDRGDVRQEA